MDESKKFENCVCERNCEDWIDVYNTDGEYLGIIKANEDDWQKIMAGHNPIDEKWEDGNGNTATLSGWGTVQFFNCDCKRTETSILIYAKDQQTIIKEIKDGNLFGAWSRIMCLENPYDEY